MIARLQWALMPILILGLGLYGLNFFAQKAMGLEGKASKARNGISVAASTFLASRPDSTFDAAVHADTLAPRSPFGQPNPPRPSVKPNGLVRPTWVRPSIILKGTVGTQAATLVNARGEKSILREGDYFDSILVLKIQPGHVTLRDSHGTFEITAQE